MATQDGEITRLLQLAHEGDKEAGDQLWKMVMDDFRRMASAKMRRERHSVTAGTTMLVNELYLKLVGKDGTLPKWDDSKHFFGSVARAMTQYLVDRARKRDSLKRGGDRERVDFEFSVGELVSLDSYDVDSIARVNRALATFQETFPRQGAVAYYRWCSGFTIEETAAALEISADRVSKDWRFAQAWLLNELQSEVEIE